MLCYVLLDFRIEPIPGCSKIELIIGSFRTELNTKIIPSTMHVYDIPEYVIIKIYFRICHKLVTTKSSRCQCRIVETVRGGNIRTSHP